MTALGATLVFNGEIYNTDELARRLSLTDFHGLSDAEILALWLDGHGEAGLDDLIGEYALAFLPQGGRSLLLARDHIGSKPLFWGRLGSKVAFGSSAAAASQILHGYARVNAGAATDVLWYGCSSQGSCFHSVTSVAAGTAVCIDRGAATERRLHRSVHLRGNVESLLREAVRKRTTGAIGYLAYSGGIDSALLRALAPTVPPLTSYCVVPRGSSVDDDVRAVAVSEVVLRNRIDTIAVHAERPVTGLTSAAFLEMASVASDAGMECQLSGEGADEIFAGYDHYQTRSSGHPFLLEKQHLREFVELTLGVASPPTLDRHILAALDSKQPEHWLEFDREVRLPEHLSAMNADLPCLLAGIEARCPYLDLWSLREVHVSHPPKRQLVRLASKLHLRYGPKDGMFFGASCLSDEDLVARIDSVSRSMDWLEAPVDLADRYLLAAEGIDFARLANPLKLLLKEALASFVLGAWSFELSLRESCRRQTVDRRLQHTCVYTENGRAKATLVCRDL